MAPAKRWWFWYNWIMQTSEIKKLTPYKDINAVLMMLTEGVDKIIGNDLVGLYLTGSLTYGDFNPDSSDIDFLTIMKKPLSQEKFEQIKQLHNKTGNTYPKWSKRIEGSYITTAMLEEALPPQKSKTPRPYINEGNFWEPFPAYGNEWTINLHVLYERGIALLGPDPKEIIDPVSIEALREASRKDLYEEWEPKLKDTTWLKNSHYQAYITLTMCRILYRAIHIDVASKKVAATWAKRELGKPWRDLIKKAENWKHGQEMNALNEIVEFIKFVMTKI
jgi:hypothetical protein